MSSNDKDTKSAYAAFGLVKTLESIDDKNISGLLSAKSLGLRDSDTQFTFTPGKYSIKCLTVRSSDYDPNVPGELLQGLYNVLVKVLDGLGNMDVHGRIDAIQIIQKLSDTGEEISYPAAMGKIVSLNVGPKGKGNWKSRVDSIKVDEKGVIGDGHYNGDNPISLLPVEVLALGDANMIEDTDTHWDERAWNIALAGIPHELFGQGDILLFDGGVRMEVYAVKKPMGRCTNGRYGLSSQFGIYLNVITPGKIKETENVWLYKSTTVPEGEQ